MIVDQSTISYSTLQWGLVSVDSYSTLGSAVSSCRALRPKKGTRLRMPRGLTLVRSGTCLKCDTCEATSGCS
jgi:hypothetical protein